MTNYDDWRVWKQVELYEERVHLSNYRYTPMEVKSICDDLIAGAYEAGLQGCYLNFQSDMEPYEHSFGPPYVTVYGYRKLTEVERVAIEKEDEVEKLAKEKGITVYEARILRGLQDKGVV